MVKISVIIPIYNAEKYLIECLESVLKQTFREYEIICIDDGSNDGSKEIVTKYVDEYDFIKMICHEKNRGLSVARNTGLKNSIGKYVFFLDSDDMIIPETLEELYQCAEQNDLDNIYFNMKRIYEPEMEHMRDKQRLEYSDYEDVYNGQEMFCHFAAEKKMKIEAWRQFYRKDFLIENEIYFYEGILHEDNLFSFLCAMKAQRVMNINKEYYIYRQHSGTIMSTMSEYKMKSVYIILLEIFRYWNNSIFPDSVNHAISYYFEALYSAFIYYKNLCQDYRNLEVGSYAEKELYKLIIGDHAQKNIASLSKEKIEKLKETKYIIVFGAGRAAMDIIQTLQKENISIYAVAVSNVEVSSKVICGLDVSEIKSLLEYRSIATIVIGVTRKYCNEVKEQLLSMGFSHLMLIDECESI